MSHVVTLPEIASPNVEASHDEHFAIGQECGGVIFARSAEAASG